MPGEISAQDLAARIAAGKPLLIVDVREDWEREVCSLPGDVHIPMNAIPSRIAEIRPPEGGEIVIYCHAGVRSMMAAGFLEQNGVARVLSLAGGIDAWSSEVDPRMARY